MKTVLKIEEWMQFLAGLYFFSQLEFAWWWFPVLILTPDIGMLGYLQSPRTGALTYNLFHHKGIAIALVLLGILTNYPWMLLVGIILFSHASLDRAVGYGLKYKDHFKHTHLDKIKNA
ncbi:DUF4260 domain-containing protein [Altibacter sp. HG106]|uniref:DUF4260 domain-containing protein n=1 Tax=Altibacter sp. HG106 TaxID=3023937 RepID=UPI00234FEB75|nr:DUF4260 domain-containing protein [Altibacter sp. HG106]MDC7994074.1 DUF4260 domain-containing protein [Altibacter sp. HG106]